MEDEAVARFLTLVVCEGAGDAAEQRPHSIADDLPQCGVERHLRRVLAEWVTHYNRGRPHSALGPGVPDPPEPAATLPKSKSRHWLTAGAFVPLNFIAVRLAQAYTHPRVFATADGGLPGKMQLPFYLSLLGIALLYVTLWRYEMTSKHTSSQLRSLRRKLAGDDAVAPVGRSAAPSLPTT